jgi:hypothetical protein
MAKRVLGILFLAAQFVAGLYWIGAQEQHVFITPYDGRTTYRLFVTVGGRALGTDEIVKRYHIPAADLAARTPEAIKMIIRHVESVYATDERAIVRMHYRLNGAEPEIWLWPES